MTVILEAERVTKKFKNQRGVDNISLQVAKGDVYGFFGPNGAGKSTMMKIMTGLSRADHGTVRLFGYDVAAHFELAMERVGVMIERAEAYDYMSGYKNLEMAGRFYPQVTRKRIESVLEIVGLGPNMREKVGHYSLGMKQRLGIASALLPDPELLILDEPTNGLDIEGMADMRELIGRLSAEAGTTVFVSSHFIHEMQQICSRIGIIHDGRLIREGRMEELLSGGDQSLEQYFVNEIRAERKAAANA